MSIFTKAETGRVYRSRFNLSHRKIFDGEFMRMIPCFHHLCMPGDILKIKNDVLIRYQPMFSPSLTSVNARIRYFFVSLRQIEKDTEKIITGSDNGKLITTTLPSFKNFIQDAPADKKTVIKHSFWDYMGVPCLDYSKIETQNCLPARYWLKAYDRIWFDYYRDENLSSYSDFELFENDRISLGGSVPLLSTTLKKNYFNSSLPFQLKGAVTPSIDLNAHFVANNVPTVPISTTRPVQNFIQADGKTTIGIDTSGDIRQDILSFEQAMNNTFSISSAALNVDQLRTMFAQTRIFEQLARTGSRYTEYLRGTFGISPADGTLQRAQYLGGFKIPILTTEVVQTAGAVNSEGEQTAVGTLRGHGISRGGDSIPTFVAKEWGVVFGIFEMIPNLQYTQGIDRTLTYKSRMDFPNPAFQHLSEQEVRNGEIFVTTDIKGDGQSDNDDTFGFQAMYNELRSSRDIVVGDMRDNLSYWTQAIHFSSRPNLNEEFIKGSNYDESFKAPFNVIKGASPFIVDCGNFVDAYRPLVRYGTPGLIDHL